MTRSPRAVPWEIALPWAVVMISQAAAAGPVRDDRGRGFVCAKAVAARTSRGVGTSVTARTPNACAWSDAGWRRGGRPNGVSTMRPKPRTPTSNVRAGDASIFAASTEDPQGCAGAWSRSKNFVAAVADALV